VLALEALPVAPALSTTTTSGGSPAESSASNDLTQLTRSGPDSKSTTTAAQLGAATGVTR
jgi:hypothetical protein